MIDDNLPYPDHKVVITGTWEGDLMYTLECLHKNTDQFFKDKDSGEVFDECIVQSWWDADSRDVLGTSHPSDMKDGEIHLNTTWTEDGSPTLCGRAAYEDWYYTT